MALRNFIKENFVLVVGLALPVLLVILFFLVSVVPRSMAVPPHYELLFTDIRYDATRQHEAYDADFFVRDGLLMARVWKSPGNYNRKRLMAYDARTQSVREVPYDLSKIGDVADRTELVLPGAGVMKLDGALKAPDGYMFEDGGYHSGGIATDIFGFGYHSAAPRIMKGAVSFSIPDNGRDYYYGNVQFVGWIIQK